MAAGENEPEPLIGDAAVGTLVRLVRARPGRAPYAPPPSYGPGLSDRHHDLLVLCCLGPGTAQPVERPVASDRCQPRPWGRGGRRRGADGRRQARMPPGRIPRPGPNPRLPLSEPPRPPPFLAEGAGRSRLDISACSVCRRGARIAYIGQIGLTSIVPSRAPGICDATSIASSRSLHSTTK